MRVWADAVANIKQKSSAQLRARFFGAAREVLGNGSKISTVQNNLSRTVEVGLDLDAT